MRFTGFDCGSYVSSDGMFFPETLDERTKSSLPEHGHCNDASALKAKNGAKARGQWSESENKLLVRCVIFINFWLLRLLPFHSTRNLSLFPASILRLVKFTLWILILRRLPRGSIVHAGS